MEKKEITKPTKKELVKALKDFHGLEVKTSEIDNDMFKKATKGWDRGLHLKTMAGRLRFEIAGGQRDANKERVPVSGVFVGSRDFVSQKKPLGKNKTQLLSFLKENDDGTLELFTDPNSPSHFKGFDKNVFGKKVSCEMLLTVNDTVTYVSPHDIEVVDEDYVIDTGLVKAYDPETFHDMDEYTPGAVLAEITSIWPLRVPNWEQDKWDDEDYPLIIKDSPVFQMYLKPIGADEDNDLIIRANVNPVNLARPFIQIDDWDILVHEDVEDIEEEVSAAFVGRPVILFGQKKKNSEYDDKRYLEMDVDGILEVEEMPEIISVTKKKKGKAKKTKSKEDKEAKKMKVRKEKVAESVTAMLEETTPDIVREMHPAKYFEGVSDEELEEMIQAEFEAQDIEMPEEEEDTEEEEFGEEDQEDEEEPEDEEDDAESEEDESEEDEEETEEVFA